MSKYNLMKFNIEKAMKVITFIFLLLIFNIINSVDQKILIISIPKCGTHLIAKAVELITGKKLAKEVLPQQILQHGISPISGGSLYRCHLHFNKHIKDILIENKFKIFFIYRDPRDQIILSAHWIRKVINKYDRLTSTQLIDFLINRLPFNLIAKYNTSNQIIINSQTFNLDQMINELILRVNKYYNSFLKWMNSNDVCVIKYENLVGSKGNGNDFLQRKEIEKICAYLNIKSERIIRHCIDNLFGGTFTFREGKIGSWKKYFNFKKRQLFKKVAGNLLIKLKY